MTELTLTLDRGRAWRKAIMLDTCSIVRPADPPGTYNPATMSYSLAAAPVYTGICRAVVWRGNEEQAAETEVAVVRYRLELPLDGTVPALKRRDVTTITAGSNPALIGLVLVLTEPEFGTTSTALRWVAEVSR